MWCLNIVGTPGPITVRTNVVQHLLCLEDGDDLKEDLYVMHGPVTADAVRDMIQYVHSQLARTEERRTYAFYGVQRMDDDDGVGRFELVWHTA